MCFRPRVHKGHNARTSNVFSSKSSQGTPRPDHQCVFFVQESTRPATARLPMCYSSKDHKGRYVRTTDVVLPQHLCLPVVCVYYSQVYSFLWLVKIPTQVLPVVYLFYSKWISIEVSTVNFYVLPNLVTCVFKLGSNKILYGPVC